MKSWLREKGSYFDSYSAVFHGKKLGKSRFRSVDLKSTLRSVVRNRLRPTDFDRLWTLFCTIRDSQSSSWFRESNELTKELISRNIFRWARILFQANFFVSSLVKKLIWRNFCTKILALRRLKTLEKWLCRTVVSLQFLK